MRYKFSLNSRVRGYIEWQLEHYHEDKRQLEEYKRELMPSVTPNYSLMPGSENVSNPTESAAVRMLTSPYILSLEISTKAIGKVLDKLDDTDKQLINLVYWRRSHTIPGAGMKLHYGKSQTHKRINDILCMIAQEMGVVTF